MTGTLKRGEPCQVACGQCCVDAGCACSHLTPEGCRWDREYRPAGCNEYLCGVARAVLDGKIDLAYGVLLKQHDREAEKLKTDTAMFEPSEEPST